MWLTFLLVLALAKQLEVWFSALWRVFAEARRSV